MKKALCLVIVCCLLLSCMTAMASEEVKTFENFINEKKNDKLDLLYTLGIFQGYENGEFKLEETLTRAQAAAVMVRLINKEDEAVKGETGFSDVNSEHWASGYISLAAEEGIINGFGDGTFCPEEKVTYHQFVKMLCCVLGYDIAAEARGGWANGGYLSVAKDIRITKDVEYENDAPLTREVTSELVYNALEIEMLDKDSFSIGIEGNVETDNDQIKNVITAHFDYQVVVGILHSNTSLEVTKTYNKNQGYYKKGDVITFEEIYSKLVGKNVAAYVKRTENGENVILTATEINFRRPDEYVMEFRDSDNNLIVGLEDVKGAEVMRNPVDDKEVYLKVFFTESGKEKFGAATKIAAEKVATGENYIGVYVNGELVLKPVIYQEINTNECVLTGVDEETAKKWVESINSRAGSEVK